MNKAGNLAGYLALIILPAIVLVYYIHTVALAKDEAMAIVRAREPVVETLTDPRTGLPVDPLTNMIMGDGYPTIKKECVRCHPTTLITTYRSDRKGWTDTIRWMQSEKGLPIFKPETEEVILTYLTSYYGK